MEIKLCVIQTLETKQDGATTTYILELPETFLQSTKDLDSGVNHQSLTTFLQRKPSLIHKFLIKSESN